MSSESPVLQIKDICKVYHIYEQPHHRLLQMIYGPRRLFFKEFWALRDLCLDVWPGESVGIIGRNGAGKSTLLQIIAGTLTATSGVCDVRGRVTALLELGSGFNPEFTGHENVMLNAAVLGMTDREIDRKYDDIVAFADIGDFLHQPVKTYSSGMKMRLAFAVQAFIDPELLIIDEALSVGDGAFQMKCMKRMREMIERRTTVLLVSHSMQTLRTFCSRVVWLDGGSIKMDGDTREVTSRYSEMLYAIAPDNGQRKPAPAPDQPGIQARDACAPIPLEHVPRTESIRRWGSGEAMVSAFSLVNAAGDFSKVYEFADKMTLHIAAEVLKALPDDRFALAFAIRNKQGLDIISIGTDRLGLFRTPPQPGETVQGRFLFDLRITPGEYSLVLAVAYNQDGVRAYMDYVENAHYFTVVADKPHYGVYEPETQAEFL